jgi:hypothetical protein
MTSKNRKPETLLVDKEAFWQLVEALLNPLKPNAALKKALAQYKKRVRTNLKDTKFATPADVRRIQKGEKS